MVDRSDVATIIRDRAIANGVDPATLLRIGQAESSLDPNAGARSSSAKGLFQFTDPTWRQYGGTADPHDAVANADAGARFTRDNAASLTQAGNPVTPASLYLAHFAGAGTANKILTADPATPAAAIMGPAAVKANPFLAGMSIGDLQGWAARKMGGDGPMASPAGAAAAPAGPGAGGMSPPGFTAPADAPAIASDPSPDDAGQQQAQIAGLLNQQSQGPAPIPLAPINFPEPPGLARARMTNMASNPAVQLRQRLLAMMAPGQQGT